MSDVTGNAVPKANGPKKKTKIEREPQWAKLSILTGCIIVVTLLVLSKWQYFFVSDWIETQKEVNPSFGVSGDFFGFPNAVFSALAFAMIIVTLVMQRYELKQQRIELSTTRRVFKMQQREMKDQNESLKRQMFENTFFSMLKLHNDIIAEISDGNQKNGRAAFVVLLASLEEKFMQSIQKPNNEFSLEVLVRVYDVWYTANEDKIGHYFRTLYNIMRYVHDSGFEFEQRATYARLVRAQLSAAEIELLFYNGLGNQGRMKMKPLIEEYALLKHLTRSGNFLIKSEYADGAFGLSRTSDLYQSGTENPEVPTASE